MTGTAHSIHARPCHIRCILRSENYSSDRGVGGAGGNSGGAVRARGRRAAGVA